jgi:hypothetical protein
MTITPGSIPPFRSSSASSPEAAKYHHIRALAGLAAEELGDIGLGVDDHDAGAHAVISEIALSKRKGLPHLSGAWYQGYCFTFLYFWVAGGGEWSLDRLRAPESASIASPSRA